MSLQVSEEAGRRLLRSMGFSDTSVQTPAAIQKRLNKIAEYSKGDYNEPKDPEDKKMLNRVIEELNDRGEVIVDGDGDGNGAATATATKTPPKKPAAAKPAPTDRTERGKAGLDRFGCREGKPGAAINREVKIRPRTVEEIAEKTGLPEARVKDHLNTLARRGFFVKDDKGRFSLSESAQKE